MMMDQEPDIGPEPLPPATREEEEAEAWEYWQQRALNAERELFVVRAGLASDPVSPGKVEGWRVPDGWKFVPVEPTDEMVKTGANRWLPTYRNIWRAMVAAAPSPPISSRAEDS